MTDFENAIRVFAGRGDEALALDLTRVPANRWKEFLGHCFVVP